MTARNPLVIVGTNIEELPSGDTINGASGGGSAIPSINDFRVSLTTGNPNNLADVTAATTLYLTPYKGTHISTRDSGTWTDHTSSQISLAVPASAYRLYNLYVYWTGSALALEADAWDSSGQTTCTITGATAAMPCVLTATNSLSVGDYIWIDGIVGSLGTDSENGLNGKKCRVSAVSGTTITIEGMDTTGFTYTSGGTVYVEPQTPTTAPVQQDGVWCKTGALDRRWVATFMTFASGAVTESRHSAMLANVDNVIDRPVWAAEPTLANWSVPCDFSQKNYPSNFDTGAGRQRIYVVAAQPQLARFKNTQIGTGFAGSFQYYAFIGLNRQAVVSTTLLSSNLVMVSGTAGGIYGNGGYVHDVKEYFVTLASGASFLQRCENTGGDIGNPASMWGLTGSALANGLVGSIKH